MQSTAKIALSMFLLTSVAASAYYNSAKLRRDGVNLFPFPRVGRAVMRTRHEGAMAEPNIKSDAELWREIMNKREPYPRTGRSSLTQADMMQYNPLKIEEYLLGQEHGNVKRESETDSGMWFGPRLGRGLRTEDEDIMRTNQIYQRGVPEQAEYENTDRKKRQTT